MANVFCENTNPHSAHSWDGAVGLEWCHGWIAEESDREDPLLAALADAERSNMHAGRCGVCEVLPQISEPARAGVIRALGGTIGGAKLASVLTSNGYSVTERQIRKHRREGHTP